MYPSEGHTALNGDGGRDFRRTSLPLAVGHNCLTLVARYKKGPRGIEKGAYTLDFELSLHLDILLHISYGHY